MGKYKVGQLIRYCDEGWPVPPGVEGIVSNADDDFIGIIEVIEKNRMFVKVLSVNTIGKNGKRRKTIMRKIGNRVELTFPVDEPFITITEISDILYG